MFVCANCGNEFSKWSGQCSVCGEWNSLKEIQNSKFKILKHKDKNFKKATIINLGKREKGKGEIEVISTQIGEFDRVLGKGIVRGSVVLFAGEPGIGKSTLLTQLIGKIGGLYVTGEESVDQIELRVKRIGLDFKKFDIVQTNSIDDLEATLVGKESIFQLMIVDSIQVMQSGSIIAGAGSVAQIKESTFRLVQLAKKTGIAIFIVGHVTKEGDIAGPKLLEHMVDTVLYFEGERTSDLRVLRTTKNRFGPTDEVGIFRMGERGLGEVEPDFANTTGEKVGSVLTIVLEGNRPILLEIQVLVVESFTPMPKRVFSGIDYNRGQLLLAVAQKILGIPIYKYDVFVAVSGGIRIDDTGADLAVVEAIYSSYKNKPISNQRVTIGEVSLLGDVKKVKGWEKRLKEAARLGKEVVVLTQVKELKK
ncbi:MAG TPA: DNA repair protein RadA [Candidatus Woesebacteria bacterium]|nr:DNA repair protein RadA [Candidatus Woesebacteria bacterium]HRT40093.1 DNA repair protein RadA [Candidatus Woesebacteria bacterium]